MWLVNSAPLKVCKIGDSKNEKARLLFPINGWFNACYAFFVDGQCPEFGE